LRESAASSVINGKMLQQLFVDREKQPEGGDTQYGAEFGKFWHRR